MNQRLIIVGFIVTLIFCHKGLSAQVPITASATTGIVEGRVFGITHLGDLKPARMPTIYLLYKGRGEKLEESSVDYHYQIASLNAMTGRLDNPSTGDEDLECRKELLDTDQTLIDTAQWALDNKKKQVLVLNGDEEGYFRIAKVPVGHYRLVARGQAGANDAYWEASIVVKTGLITSIKLTSPGKSCLRAE